MGIFRLSDRVIRSERMTIHNVIAFRCRWAVALAAVCLAGCRGEQRLEVAPVRGQVLYNGRAVPNATVIFHPIGETAEQLQKMRPYDDADADGRFELKTYVTGDGAPPGDYEVAIIAMAGGADRESGTAASGSAPSLPRALVQKYADHKQSGIKVKVVPGENKLEPFELK